MREDLTIVYYSHNRENPIFEENIKRDLKSKIGDLPLISVTQKPIDFGKNICVGEVGISGHNAFRQLFIGVEQATTKYICPAESDMVYSPQYFDYIPPTDDIFYLAMPLHVLFNQRRYARHFALKPHGSESAMVVSRDLVLNRMKSMFKGADMWGPIEAEVFLLRKQPVKFFDAPVVTFKTDNNMHRRTPHDFNHRVKEIEPWGNVYDMIRRFNDSIPQ